MTTRLMLGLPSLLLVCSTLAACGPRVDNDTHAAAIRSLVSGAPPAWAAGTPLGERLWRTTQAVYEGSGHQPLWVDGLETTPQWKALVQELRYAAAHGLDPAAYWPDEFEALRDASQTRLRGTQFPAERVPEMDVRMTYAYLHYAADLLGWTRRSTDVYEHWITAEKDEDLAARLRTALADGDIRASLEALAPTHPQYQGLQAALAGGALTPEQQEQVRLNMERWRWAPRELGDRYVLVNVPAYQMQIMEGTRPALAMRVIVGEPKNPTPLFSDEMTYLVFSPYWNIPAGIMAKETLPKAARDPDFLLRNDIEVVGTGGESIDPWTVDWSDESAAEGLRFRQRPGAGNALGLVKFMFPNRFSVYLHDTPGDRLFFKESRAFSHGCVRVEQPLELATYVLADQEEWTEARIQEAMHAQTERAVKLRQPLPVHIGYWTAWVEADGKTVTFTEDPYGLDAKHARLRDAS